MPLREKPGTSRKLFTIEEYHRAVEAGVFDEGNKVELIEGEIYPIAAMGSRHAACVNRLTRLFVLRVGDEIIVRARSPIELSDISEPEPDVALLKFRDDFYAGGHPKPSDTLLAVEISDTTLSHDVNVKLPAYARAGIREAWIVDLNAATIRVHTNPENGAYRHTSRVGREETFDSKTIPGGGIAVKEIIG